MTALSAGYQLDGSGRVSSAEAIRKPLWNWLKNKSPPPSTLDVLSDRAAQGRGRAFPRGGKASSRGFFWHRMDVSTLQPTPFSSIQFHACSPYHALALSIAPCSLRFAKGEAVVFTTAAAFHIGEQLHEGGNLSVTALRAVWLPTDVAGAGWAVRFSEMSLHAVCRDLEAVPRPCIYCQLDREDDAANEVMFIPDDEAQGTKHRLLLNPPGHIHCGVWKVERNGTRAFVGTGRGFAGWGWYRIVVRNRVRSYAIALFLRRFFPCLLLHPLSHHRSLCPPSLSLSLSLSLTHFPCNALTVQW